jgi:hypothetical protein
MYYQDYENKVDEVNFIMHSLLTCVSCKLEYIHLHYQDYENKLDEVNFIMHNSFVTNITVLRITLKHVFKLNFIICFVQQNYGEEMFF